MALIRTTLPTYDALTDTNADHYSLIADEDNVLIKKKMSDPEDSPFYRTINASSAEITHGLGYIPLFVTYQGDPAYSPTRWGITNQFTSLYSFSGQSARCDTNKIYLDNTYATNRYFATDVFYDDMVGGAAPSIVETTPYFKIARPGKDAEASTNPNDYIIHSNLSSLKILKEGTAALHVVSAGPPGINDFVIPHGADIADPVKFFLFAKFPDGKTSLIGGSGSVQYSYDTTFYAMTAVADTTNIYVHIQIDTPTDTTVYVKYYIYGTGKSGTLISGAKVKVAKPGIDADTDTNPDNFYFINNYNTLKYHTSNPYNLIGYVARGGTLTGSITHDLGYTPFFAAFVKDYPNSLYAITPYTYDSVDILGGGMDLYVNTFADSTKLYFQVYLGYSSLPNQSVWLRFYYKIFKNNLGL